MTFITVSGLDGAGKTTLVHALRAELEARGQRVSVLHQNDHIGIFAWLRALRDRLGRRHRDPDAPPRLAPRPTRAGRARDAVVWSATLRRLVYPIDVAWFLILRFWIVRVRGRVLLMDRCFYDTLVDLAVRMRRPPGALLLGLAPRPDVAFFLDIEPEEAYARKKEYDIPYLARRAEAYRALFPRIPVAVRLPPLSAEAARQEAARVIGTRTGARGVAPAHDEAAAILLACILGEDRDPATVAWEPVVARAARERMVLRLAAWFEARWLPLPGPLVPLAHAARARAEDVAATIDRIGGHCAARGVPHVFLKLAQAAPDVGRDLDLLVAAYPGELPSAPAGVVLDLEVGTLGYAGEHHRYAASVLARAIPGTFMGVPCSLPSVEDRLLLLAVSRVYGRPAVRFRDACYATRLLGGEAVDPARLTALATRYGLQAGLAAFLELVDQVVRPLRGASPFDARIRSRLPLRRWGAVTERDGRYRVPALRTAPRLYAQLLVTGIRAGDWRALRGLARLPLLALGRADRAAPRPWLGVSDG